MPPTLVLDGRDVDALLGLDACIDAVETAFRLHAERRSLPPASLGIHAQDGTFHVKTAGLEIDGRHYVAAKTNANFPENPRRLGRPTIQGVIVLFDGACGAPLAVMDSIVVTSRRTAAATAVAAKYLALPDADTVTLYGCGEQGRAHLEALARVLPLARASVFDIDRDKAHRLADGCRRDLGFDVAATDTPAASLRTSQVCVTCTTASRPIVHADQLAPGTFVAAVGADNPGKQELDPAILAENAVVVDTLESCAANGELRHAIAACVMTRDDVRADLAELVSSRKRGRRSADEIIIFDSTGIALEDVAAAVVVYREALRQQRGHAFELGPAS
jgi:ornithine cyclodeaminase/alanine dehydrogenase-like protein (mu-crystallin family)